MNRVKWIVALNLTSWTLLILSGITLGYGVLTRLGINLATLSLALTATAMLFATAEYIQLRRYRYGSLQRWLKLQRHDTGWCHCGQYHVPPGQRQRGDQQ